MNGKRKEASCRSDQFRPVEFRNLGVSLEIALLAARVNVNQSEG
jgi:hypothetical protein